MLSLSTLIIGWLLTLVIVTGNDLVIYLITARQNLRTTTNWFVLSLAVADFGAGAFYFPRYSTCLIYDQSCVNQAVIIVSSIGYLFVFVSVTNLCALTLDRYLAIVKPLRYVTFMTKKRVALLIFASWSVAFTVLLFYLSSHLTSPGNYHDSMKRIFWLYIHCLEISACGFLLFATARILLIVRKIARQNAAVVAQLNFNHRIQHRVAFKARETASAKMIGVVVIIFVLCSLLETIQHVFYGLLITSNSILVTILVPLLKLVNSAANPVAYAFCKREIRRELKRRFCREYSQV